MGGIPGVTGYQAVEVLRERCAEQARAQANLLAAVWDVVTALAPDSDFRTNGPDEFAVDEVRAALGLTRRAAGLLVERAAMIVHRLPCLHAAMAAGALDEPRARILAELTADLADSSALAICEQLLPHCAPDAAGRLTTGRLTDRVKARAIALDPEWAQRRYESSLTQQRVIGRRQEEGSASLSGTHLPLERVATSVAHISALASRAKAAGDARPIDHIRAELFCGMTDGTYAGLTDRQILQALSATGPDSPKASRGGCTSRSAWPPSSGWTRCPVSWPDGGRFPTPTPTPVAWSPSWGRRSGVGPWSTPPVRLSAPASPWRVPPAQVGAMPPAKPSWRSSSPPTTSATSRPSTPRTRRGTATGGG